MQMMLMMQQQAQAQQQQFQFMLQQQQQQYEAMRQEMRLNREEEQRQQSQLADRLAAPSNNDIPSSRPESAANADQDQQITIANILSCAKAMVQYRNESLQPNKMVRGREQQLCKDHGWDVARYKQSADKKLNGKLVAKYMLDMGITIRRSDLNYDLKTFRMIYNADASRTPKITKTLGSMKRESYSLGGWIKPMNVPEDLVRKVFPFVDDMDIDENKYSQ